MYIANILSHNTYVIVIDHSRGLYAIYKHENAYILHIQSMVVLIYPVDKSKTN